MTNENNQEQPVEEKEQLDQTIEVTDSKVNRAIVLNAIRNKSIEIAVGVGTTVAIGLIAGVITRKVETALLPKPVDPAKPVIIDQKPDEQMVM